MTTGNEWIDYRLYEITSIMPSNVDKKTYPSEIPIKLCNYMDVYNSDYITGKEDFMDASATQSEIAKFALKEGDVIITKDSETPDDIGIPTVIMTDLPNVLCGYHLALIRPSMNYVDGVFLSKVISTNSISNYLARYANGSTRYGLSVSSIENIQINLPPLSQNSAR